MKKGRKSYHGVIFTRSSHETRYGGLHVSQQLSVDGCLEKAVEVLSMGKVQEVKGVTSRYWHGVQQQVHQLLTLQYARRGREQ